MAGMQNLALIFDPAYNPSPLRVFALCDDDHAARIELGRILSAWGLVEVELSSSRPPRLTLPDGRAALVFTGARAALGARFAVVVRSGALPVAAYLMLDLASAAQLHDQLTIDGFKAGIAQIEVIPDNTPDDAPTVVRPGLMVPFGVPVSLAELCRKLGAAPPISHVFGMELCPRCQDHTLELDPELDARDSGGQRICLACARLPTLRRRPDS